MAAKLTAAPIAAAIAAGFGTRLASVAAVAAIAVASATAILASSMSLWSEPPPACPGCSPVPSQKSTGLPSV